MKTFETALSRAKGLGSAGEGSHHWWAQKLSSVAMLPLIAWLLYSLAHVDLKNYSQLHAWLSGTFNSLMMIAFLLMACWHLQLGLQVIIEDYLKPAWLERSVQMLVRFACLLMAIAGVLAVVKISLGASS